MLIIVVFVFKASQARTPLPHSIRIHRLVRWIPTLHNSSYLYKAAKIAVRIVIHRDGSRIIYAPT